MSPGDAVDLHRILMGVKLPGPDSEEETNEGERDEEVEEISPTTGEDASPSKEEKEVTEIVGAEISSPPGRKRTVSLAIHFGTFCSGPAESRDTVRTLRKECRDREIGFMKLAGREGVIGADERDTFLVVDHGGTVSIEV